MWPGGCGCCGTCSGNTRPCPGTSTGGWAGAPASATAADAGRRERAVVAVACQVRWLSSCRRLPTTPACRATLVFARTQARVLGPVISAVILSTIFLSLVRAWSAAGPASVWRASRSAAGLHMLAAAVCLSPLVHNRCAATPRRSRLSRTTAGPRWTRRSAMCRWTSRSPWWPACLPSCTSPARGPSTAPCCRCGVAGCGPSRARAASKQQYSAPAGLLPPCPTPLPPSSPARPPLQDFHQRFAWTQASLAREAERRNHELLEVPRLARQASG